MFSYEMILDYYRKGLFSQEDLDSFVECGWITSEEVILIVQNDGGRPHA